MPRTPAPNDGRSVEQVYTTTEGPVVITTRGKLVFVSESFSLDLARKLTALILDAQGTGEMKMANATKLGAPSLRLLSGARVGEAPFGSEPGTPGLPSEARQPLTGDLVHLFSDCGVMKAVVDAGVRSAVRLK